MKATNAERRSCLLEKSCTLRGRSPSARGRRRGIDALAGVDSADGAGGVVVLGARASALGVELPQGRNADGARECRAVVEALERAAVQHLRRAWVVKLSCASDAQGFREGVAPSAIPLRHAESTTCSHGPRR